MSAEAAEATVVAEEPAPEKVAEQQKPEQKPLTSFAEALLKAAREDGHEVAITETPKATESTTSEPELESTTEPEPETTEVEIFPKESGEAKPEAEPPKGLSIGEQIAWYKDKGDKPPWFLERIAEQTATLGKRTERLEKAEAKVQELESQLTKQQGPQPTQEQPFADVYDRNELVKLENTYEKILELAIKHPNGVEQIVTGKNLDGTDKIEDFDADQIADMRYKADKALRKDIPARLKVLDQRDKYIVERREKDAIGLEKYPEFKDQENPMTQEAVTLLKQNPSLEMVLGPEVIIHLGRYLKGKALESQNGNGSASDAANRITQAAKTKIAPTVTRTRSMPERKGADIESAKKQFTEKGDADSAEALVGALLSKNRGTVKKIESLA